MLHIVICGKCKKGTIWEDVPRNPTVCPLCGGVDGGFEVFDLSGVYHYRHQPRPPAKEAHDEVRPR